MTVDIPRKDYAPIPSCQLTNVQEWRSRVIEAFATNGMGDYLFNESTLDQAKMAIGIAIILPSLSQGFRTYLTKMGYDFASKQADPRKLFTLVQAALRRCDLVLRRETLLYDFYRVEKNTNESAEQYLQRVESMRESLKEFDVNASEMDLTRVALFGLRAQPATRGWALRRITEDVAAGNLSFKALTEKLIAYEAKQKQEACAKAFGGRNPEHHNAS